MKVNTAVQFDLFFDVEYRMVRGLWRDRETVRILINFRKVEHHVKVATSVGSIQNVAAVPVPDFYRFPRVSTHVPQAGFCETAWSF